MEKLKISQCPEEQLDQAYQMYAPNYPHLSQDKSVLYDRLSQYFLIAQIQDQLVGYVIAQHQTSEFMKSEIRRMPFINKLLIFFAPLALTPSSILTWRLLRDKSVLFCIF